MATALRTELDEPRAQIHCDRATQSCILDSRLGRELGAAQTAEGRLDFCCSWTSIASLRTGVGKGDAWAVFGFGTLRSVPSPIWWTAEN